MTATEYDETQKQLILIAQLITDLDLNGFLAEIERADALGPVVDPTLWIAAQKPMTHVRKLAEAALEMQRVARELWDAVKAEQQGDAL